jgi:hypothetical protein
MLLRRWMWIAWPAFLAAGVMEMLVFAVVDPLEMQWLRPMARCRAWACARWPSSCSGPSS